MKKRILRYLKHIVLTILIPLPFVMIFGLYQGATLHLEDNPVALHWDNEGPYIFYSNDSTVNVNYIKKHANEEFFAFSKGLHIDSLQSVTCYYPLDSSQFQVPIKTSFQIPNSIYHDKGRILAISDIESNYKAFRDFLIHSNVINENLEWIFGNGHLVLAGDFVDRGYFTTQVLWFIYKLERAAEKAGGFVHFIIGNHELKMMHGDYHATSGKYYHVASLLGKKQVELYDQHSFIGKWMASKNAMEMINGNLFVHGGIHPDFAITKFSLEEINERIRNHYYHSFSIRSVKDTDQFIHSTLTGPCWYRGYFREDLSQQQVEASLAKFNANAVVVGHTLQSKVTKAFNGKVFGIDVKHPSDHRTEWPSGKSEGLLIEGDTYYRVLASGEKIKL
ncbi:MAG: metallophosphoesterase [Cyclobacteriaceae bacterium]